MRRFYYGKAIAAKEELKIALNQHIAANLGRKLKINNK